MKATNFKKTTTSAMALAMVVWGGAAFAESTWTLTDCSNSQNLGSTAACSSSGSAAGLTLSGYSNGTSTTSTNYWWGWIPYTVDKPNQTNNAANFSAANVYDWGSGAGSGMGVVAGNESSGATGPHAMDNGYGIDAMLLNFGSSLVSLTNLTIGWNGTDNPTSSDNGTPFTSNAISYKDSDLSVFAWTGSGAPSLSSTSPTGLTALGSGWALVGNYADVGASNGVGTTAAKQGGSQGISSGVYSSYWLISAYSSVYGGSGTNLDQGNDAFKLLSVAGNTKTSCTSNCGSTDVPEPGSMALMGAAMMGFVASRRRKQKTA